MVEKREKQRIEHDISLSVMIYVIFLVVYAGDLFDRWLDRAYPKPAQAEAPK